MCFRFLRGTRRSSSCRRVRVSVLWFSGDWLAVVAHTQKYSDEPRCPSYAEEFKTQCVWGMVVGYGIYFGCCGYLQVSRQLTRVRVFFVFLFYARIVFSSSTLYLSLARARASVRIARGPGDFSSVNYLLVYYYITLKGANNERLLRVHKSRLYFTTIFTKVDTLQINPCYNLLKFLLQLLRNYICYK